VEAGLGAQRVSLLVFAGMGAEGKIMKLKHHKLVLSDGTSKEWDERTLEVGEQVWIVYGRLVVKCTILVVDDYFRTTGDPGCEHAYLFYDVDEPIGHSLTESELFVDILQAAESLKRRFDGELDDPELTDLDKMREMYLRFISGTHGEHAEESYKAMKADLGGKKRGEDWFTYNDIINAHPTPQSCRFNGAIR